MNATVSAPVDDIILELGECEKLIAVAVYVVIAVLGISGNSLVLIAVACSLRLRTITNIFVVALAITDLLTAILQIHHVIFLLLASKSRHDLCLIIGPVNFNLIGYSMATLALLAVNRMQVVTNKPSSRFKQTAKKAIASILVSFFLLTLCSSLGIAFGQIKFQRIGGICDYVGPIAVDISISLGVYIVFILTVIVFCYTKTYRHVRQHFRKVAHDGLSTEHENTPSKEPLKEKAFGGQRFVMDLETRDITCHPENDDVQRFSQVTVSSKTHDHDRRNISSSSQKMLATPGNSSQIPEVYNHSRPNSPKKLASPSMAEPLPRTCMDQIPSGQQGSDIAGNENDHEVGNQNVFSIDVVSTVMAVASRSNRIDRHERISAEFTNRNKIARIRQNNRIKAEYKITLNMILIVFTFFACMTPSMIVLFLSGDQDFGWISFLMLISNCCWNPIIYAWKHPDFKHTFGCILRGKFCRIKEPVPWLRRRLRAN
ncbi:probable G-protein coupled receptor No9 [Lytechinus variegatus]|uniref:probable G-protein coupled receptor No9 n=1 Tax=Lytechinus variegatus TaxID=7654 RepID=UPI001BB1A84B|nr:probable G-protein coupled receptor No9 [Lytechinus variegatus]